MAIIIQELEPPAAGGILSEMDAADVAELMAVMDYDDGAAAVLADARARFAMEGCAVGG